MSRSTKPAAESRGHQPDYLLALVIGVLLAIGMVMIYSISPIASQSILGNSSNKNFYFDAQFKYMIIGLFVWIVAANYNYLKLKRWAPLLMVGALVCVVAVLSGHLSYTVNGATRWLKLGWLSFQPAELLKLATILYLAAWFERRGEEVRTFWDGLVPFGIMLFVTSFIIAILQKDMGTMLVLAGAALGMFWAAGVKISHFIVLLAAAVAAGWIAIISFPHRLSRLTEFLHPGTDPTGSGYQISQSLIGIGSGGLLGVGLGRSIQVYGYLPEAPNDSIFAIIAEEFGLLGALVVIALFVVLAYRGFKIAKTAPDSFSRLVATGITLWLLVQALINIAAMLSLVPLTGIPLPFISYGGTSLVFSLAAAGILLNISKYTVKEARYANSGERGRNGWSYFANPGNARRVKTAR